MSKQTKAMVAGPGGAVAASPVASTSKPTKGQKSAKKTLTVQGDAGVAAYVPVPVMSKPQSVGFAAKQMPDDPAWTALLHDLGTMPTMALRAKYAGEANTHRNMLQQVKTCGAVVHPAKRVLKMLEEKGLKPLALEVAPDGGFRFEVAPLSGPISEPTENPWDKVL